jgi:hypothetical protein
MKLLKIIFALMLVFFVATSCKKEIKETTVENSQMQEVLAIHDEVMPKMGTIGKLITQMDEKIKETDSTEAFVNASLYLKDSHKEMMDWMKNFGDSFDSDEILKGKSLTDEKQKLLEEEEAKIKALRDKMNFSIITAEELLN